MRARGFTLLETVAATTLLAIIVVSVAMAQIYTLDRADTNQRNEDLLARASRVLQEIHQAIRLSEEIVQADADVLALETRYFLDTDGAIEKVRYSRQGNALYREVAEGAGPYDAPELVLEHVAAFQSHFFSISDSFDAGNFGPLVEGGLELLNAMEVDGSIQTTYALLDLGAPDSDLVDAYIVARERVELDGSSGPVVATLTPPLRRHGLRARVSFVPTVAASRYEALAYGNDPPSSHGIVVVFDSDHSLRLQRLETNTVVAQSASTTESWTAGDEYTVTLEMWDSSAFAIIESDGNTTVLGPVDVSDLDEESVHFATGPGGLGAWDDLEIEYPWTEITLGVSTSAGVEVLRGGAGRRLP